MEAVLALVVCLPPISAVTRQRLTRAARRLIVSLPFTAIAVASTVAPRIEIYTMLVCSVYSPSRIILASTSAGSIYLRQIWPL